MHPRRLTRLVALGATSAVVAGAPIVVSAPALADHGGGPSAGEVAASRAAVAQRERQVARAAAAVARTQASLDRLTTAAEVAVEAYDAARVKQQAAQRDVVTAQLVLEAAGARVRAARARVGRFAAAAYMSGGLSQMNAMLTSSDPSMMLYRIGTLEVISRSQRDALQEVDAARVYQQMVRQQADAALARATSATRAAARARAGAQHAVARQTALLSGLKAQQQQLAVLLRQAQQHASALERARLEAIARARAEAAARAAAARAAAARAAAAAAAATAAQSPGAGSSAAGTVSAGTEQQAVNYAESQIGKPYQWGAAGPDTYDCSGLTMWAYAQVGVSLLHWTGFQWNEGAHISASAARPGDLFFFATNTSDPNTIHHVGMYIGNGEMVEAPFTGADVRISNAYRPDLIGVVRPYAT